MAARSALYLLDTNIIIAAMKGQAEVRARLERTPLEAIVLSPIVLGELEFGAEKSADRQRNFGQRNFDRLTELTTRLTLAPIDRSTIRHYARIRSLLEKRGRGIGANDTWIAAHALGLGAIVVTDNAGEFSRVPDLPIENWLRGH
ncbi:MAG: PIN domain-containing protein [Burkholderiaceae bacterium]|nr:PIN domain-containing protein [Burkholderiaceae bacterium]